MSLPGFYRAPITKLLCVGSVVGYFAIGSSAEKLRLDIASISQLRISKLLTSSLSFSSPGELLLGVILLYTFRQFERQMGSRKFAPYALGTSLVSFTLQAFFLLLIPSTRYVSPGPYGLLFSMFVGFYCNIPTLNPRNFTLMGLNLSEKVPTYLIGLQLMFNDSSSSFAAAISGILSGILFLGGPLSRVQSPEALSSPFRKYVLPLIASSAPVFQRGQTNRTAGGGGGGAVQRRRGPTDDVSPGTGNLNNSVPAMVGGTPPSEDNIAQLTNLGFSRDDAIAALRACDNNIQHAASRLVGS